MMKSTPQDLHVILKFLDDGIEDEDFPLVLRSPNEVDAELDDINDFKFQLRPRPASDDDERMAVTTATGSHDEDDNDDAMEEANDNNCLPLFNDKIKFVEEVEIEENQQHDGSTTFCPFTPPPRLILKPRLRPRPKAKSALRPHALRRSAAPFPFLGRSSAFKNTSFIKNNARPLPKMCAIRPPTMNVVSSDGVMTDADAPFASFPRLSLELVDAC